MIYRLASALTLVIPLGMATPAMACQGGPAFDPSYVRHADIVVVGRIVDYKKLDDYADHANFKIIVKDVLVGKAYVVLSVVWGNSTFARPDALPTDPMLIALRNRPTVRLDNNSQPILEVLQVPCSKAFMFIDGSDRAKAVREAMARRAESDR